MSDLTYETLADFCTQNPPVYPYDDLWPFLAGTEPCYIRRFRALDDWAYSLEAPVGTPFLIYHRNPVQITIWPGDFTGTDTPTSNRINAVLPYGLCIKPYGVTGIKAWCIWSGFFVRPIPIWLYEVLSAETLASAESYARQQRPARCDTYLNG